MAQTRLIQDLVELITPNNNDVFVVVDNTTNPSLSVTKKISYASLKEDLQDMINVLTSGGTGINASYNDAGNVLTLSVVDDTTTQRTIISSGGTTIGTRQKLNFIKGSGISFVGADNAGDNRVDLTVAVVPSEISINSLNTSSPLSIALGGTNATTATDARNNIGAAKAGSNSDITNITGLTTPLSIAQGGTAASTAQNALKNLAGLKSIKNIATAGVSIVSQEANLVNNEYRGELRGIKAADTTISVAVDGNDISVGANAQNILNGATADVNFNAKRLTNIGEPQSSNDAATRGYVDQVGAGLTVKEAVIAATTTNIASTYGANALTVTGTGTPSIDGVSITATGTRVLIKNQTTATQNGIYTLTTPASAGVSAVFTRAADYNSSEEVKAGTFMFVVSGTTNKSLQFVQTTPTPTLDTSPLVFTILNDTTIADNSVDNAKLSDMAALTIKGAVASGNPQDLTANQAIGILNSGSTKFTSNVLPLGSTSASGILQLYDGVNSTSSAFAATAASVKTAYDTAAAASGVAAAAMPVSGGTFTGAVSGLTAAPGTNTTQLATTAFVQAAIPAAANNLLGGTTTVTATGKTLTNNEFCTVTTSGLTLTLPLSPAAGNSVGISVAGSFVNTTIARNGENIMGLAENLTIDRGDVTVLLRYVDATRGWRIV